MSHTDSKKISKTKEGDVHENDTNNETQHMLSESDKLLALPFEKPDVTLRIGQVEFSVNKSQLMAESAVMAAMFKPGFKEEKLEVVKLPGKDPSHVLHFLRHLLPGYTPDNGSLSDISHDILPLVEEYQAENLKKKIDICLAASINPVPHILGSNVIIDAVIEAELYRVPRYLKACIERASKIIHHELTVSPKYTEISTNTRLEIATLRCTSIDAVFRGGSIEKVPDVPATGIFGTNAKNTETVKCDWDIVGKALVQFYQSLRRNNQSGFGFRNRTPTFNYNYF